MIKFFRHIRKSLLMENKTGKYFKYAIGEIILVVIGILIALSINNWNEKRQNKLKVGNLLQKIQKNIKADLSEINAITNFYATKDSLIGLVMGNKLTIEDYQSPNSNHLHSLIFNAMQINLKNIGFNNLMRAQDIIPPEYEAILDKLYLQYNDHLVYAQDSENELLESLTKFNDILFEKYDWYSSEVQGSLNAERVDYFLNNVRYKGMVREYQTIAIHNYLNFNQNYAKAALDAYNAINKILSKQDEKPIGFNDLETNPEIKGKYKTLFGETFQLIIKDNRNYIVSEAKDSSEWLHYAPNKFAVDGQFIRFGKQNDSINLYVGGYENGSKPFATKIEIDND